MKSIKEKLIEAGYKLTKPRLAVLIFLSENHKPMSARELSKNIKTVDRASVYRTLNILEKLGLVNVDMINKEKLYCSAGKPHHHIICTGCGYVEKIECNHSFRHKNFTNINHQLTVTGLCDKCS